ncbi:hypothetical protein FQR65_LT05671 [Abscondita terminalis]|nr:hypothetical protein FQR65_LT05671 [Abscondita terminalis]
MSKRNLTESRHKSVRESGSHIVRTGSDGSVTYLKRATRQRTQTELNAMKKEMSTEDHMITLEQLEKKYTTSVRNGLTHAKAVELLTANGPNCLVPSPPKSHFRLLMEFYFGGFAGLLWVGAILTIIGYLFAYIDNSNASKDQLYLALVLVTVVLITGTFGYQQEKANIKIIQSFKKLVPNMATVIRDGKVLEIHAEELVVGDLVMVKGGDIIPADIRIIICSGLKVDNSSITGESDMIPRSTECTDKNPLETQNLAFYGTNTAEGAGTGIVIATGDDTLIGRIAGLTSGLQPEEMPIKKELRYFNKMISIIAIVIGLTFFISALIVGMSFFESFSYLMALIVANVPEGMLVTMTACLTLTAKSMAKKNCLVKNIEAIETLGSTNVICSDKTGTLTQNCMTVSHFYYDDFTIDVVGNLESVQRTEGFSVLCRVATLCSNAEFAPNQERVPIEKRKVTGDSSESAVLKAMELYVGNTKLYKTECPKVLEIPFNSTNKYQLSIHEMFESSSHLLVMKGAPERILESCSTYFSKESSWPLTAEKRQEFNQIVFKLGYMGERVLGFADLELPGDLYPIGYRFNTESINFPLEQLRFVGFISMVDPPRVSVPDAVEKCRNAGIRVIMITGDHPITAVAIAKKVGIIGQQSETVYDVAMRKHTTASKISIAERNGCTAAVITGNELREMSQDQLETVLTTYAEIVFARTSPQQKLKIVEALQSLGSIVAVTGDGFNDSPALKKADIGIAMGISGADVTKEAADMILLDDNFASIVTGVEEGRLIYDNLKKSIAYVLTSNVPEVVPFMFIILLNWPNTLSVISILIIDVGTDLWPAISLAYETPEADIMSKMPRDPSVDKLVSPKLIAFTYLQIGIIQACAGYTAYFITMANHGFFYDRLMGIRNEWDADYINDLEDSYGHEWTYEERKYLERIGYSTFFMAIVLTQIADAIIVKTRRLSITQHGMTNWILNFGIIFEIFLALFVVYCPGLNRALQFAPIRWAAMMPAIPFALFIIIYDEIRRYFIRKYPDGWVATVTYY